MPLQNTTLDTDSEAFDIYAPAVQPGVDAGLSDQKSRVQIPLGAPRGTKMTTNFTRKDAAAI